MAIWVIVGWIAFTKSGLIWILILLINPQYHSSWPRSQTHWKKILIVSFLWVSHNSSRSEDWPYLKFLTSWHSLQFNHWCGLLGRQLISFPKTYHTRSCLWYRSIRPNRFRIIGWVSELFSIPWARPIAKRIVFFVEGLKFEWSLMVALLIRFQ